MRRPAFVLLAAACALLIIQAPASAKCVVLPFDIAVYHSQVVWWGTVTGTQHEPGTADFAGGWTLTLRLQAVLKGPGSVGETHLAVPALCSMTVFSQKDAQQYVGRTQLFIGRLHGDVLVPIADVLTPQDLSPTEQYRRALTDLTQSVSALPLIAGGLPLWVIVAAVSAVVVVVVALGTFIIVRRRHGRRGRTRPG